MYTFINTPDDMAWLREVHLPMLDKKYKAALLYGNEDYPDEIIVYETFNPIVDARGKHFRYNNKTKKHEEFV